MALSKAELHTEKGEVITCLFNPAEISVSKSNSWGSEDNKGGNAPQLRFQGGQSATVTMSLTLDTSTTGEAVTTHTDKLLGLLKVDTSLPGADASNGSARPPWVQFRWGATTTFKAVLERLQLRYTYFSSGGVPLRAKADITLKQWADEAASLPLQNPTSHTPRTHRVHRLVEGETLDKLAARYFRDPTLWRLIARANRIVDPLELPIGQPLIIPDLPVRHRG
jgi:hypothetical protein